MSPSRSAIRSRISLNSGAGDQSSSVGLIGAILIHAAIVAATFFTWEHRLDIIQETPPIVPVDLVTLGQKTNIMPTVRPERRIEPPKIEEPKPQVTDLQPMPLPKVEPEPEPAPRVVTPPKPVAKPEPKPKKSTAENFAALLNKLATPAAQPQNAKPAQQTRKGFGQQNAMTMDLIDTLRNQIEQCWSPPAGAPHPEQLIVYVHLDLNPDGSVARAPQLTAQSASAAATNPFIRAAADAAMRAIYVCAPYKQLPSDRYAEWRDSDIRFDPRDLAGQ